MWLPETWTNKRFGGIAAKVGGIPPQFRGILPEIGGIPPRFGGITPKVGGIHTPSKIFL
ncbi:hypothetical protein ACSU64_17570 [Bacillaceae bacterium C204]|uniref:hypothetical protein n=1 Tax=Neobacillus sp. 204 TaxID=3383351 RepID=UPI0039794306